MRKPYTNGEYDWWDTGIYPEPTRQPVKTKRKAGNGSKTAIVTNHHEADD